MKQKPKTGPIAGNRDEPITFPASSTSSLLVRNVLFILFFVSGFCGLLYQVVWTRLAFAKFGIVTPVMSVVISSFMLGLALGSWIGGKVIGPITRKMKRSAALFYALAEAIIGAGAFAVPGMFALGDQWLLGAGEFHSAPYLWLSAVVIALSLLPWCVCMGTTFPFMMAYVREREAAASPASFSFLYSANVLGAISGVILTAVVLVELFGFRGTLLAGCVANLAVAGVAVWLGSRAPAAAPVDPAPRKPEQPRVFTEAVPWIEGLLFITGFASLGMEVVWIRAFTPHLKTQVYSFALVLFVYLLATYLGATFYRWQLARNRILQVKVLIGFLAAAALLPVVADDFRWLEVPDGYHIHTKSSLLLLVSIFPFCLMLGYLSPHLVDIHAQGNPRGAGRAYALNVIGCVLGPLFAAYVLLPRMDIPLALVTLTLPLLVFLMRYLKPMSLKQQFISCLLTGVLLVASLFFTQSFEGWVRQNISHTEVRRDYAATTISGGQGEDLHLLVNGIGMTRVTPITKCMAHLPLAFHKGRPESALVICFGMGTSFRSAMSWDIRTTAVELVPGVKEAFGFYFSDAPNLINRTNGRIVVDDGRRYLKRVAEKYDVIVVDPPPPINAAGSSLLYSEEFYKLARQRLNPGGILQAWFPGEASATETAVAHSIYNSFPYVLAFRSVEGWGTHFLASMEPLENLDVDQLLRQMPARASKDLFEWNDPKVIRDGLADALGNLFGPKNFKSSNPDLRLTDDRPYNEYFLLRSWGILPSD